MVVCIYLFIYKSYCIQKSGSVTRSFIHTHTQAESLLHRLEQAAGGIRLHVNVDKTENIFILKGGSLKLMDKFPYFGSSISSTENDISVRQAKAWTAINRLSIKWKLDLSDKIKRYFFQAAIVSILLYGCTTWMLT